MLDDERLLVETLDEELLCELLLCELLDEEVDSQPKVAVAVPTAPSCGANVASMGHVSLVSCLHHSTTATSSLIIQAGKIDSQ